MTRALIITYYWPPSGGGGVQRWLKMTRFLREYGIEPVVCVPDDPDYPVLDESLLAEIPEGVEIIRVPVFEPFRAVRTLLGKRNKKELSVGFIEGEKTGWLTRVLGYIRGNYIIPDARKFWVKPLVKILAQYLQNHPADVLISTGPPHSVHLAGAALKRNTGIRWVADFRDFWKDMDHIEHFQMGERALKKHASLELKVLREADRVVAVTPTMAERYSALAGREVDLITNGFDERDFEQAARPKDDEIVIGHFGTLGADRFTPAFWDALAALLDEHATLRDKLRIALYGPTDASTLQYIRQSSLSAHLDYRQYVSHAEAVEAMRTSRLLLLVLNDNNSELGRLPGKIFEYLASAVPVLGLGSVQSDASLLLQETGCGQMLERQDDAGIRSYLETVLLGESSHQPKREVIGQYTRRALAEKYADLLKGVAAGT